MQVIHDIHSMHIERPTGIGLGNFDGLHIGHMTLIHTLISESRFYGIEPMIYTFTKHPENILRKKLFTPLLTTQQKKIQLLSETPLERICFQEFDENFSRIKPEVFVKEVLLGKLKMQLAVAGFNYRFGYRGEGDTTLLKELGNRLGFRVIIIPPVKIENEVVSSTLIREYVAKGEMEKVFRLLGRHYSVTGDVKDGKKLGSKLGFPTANIHPENYLILPHRGVYITKTLLSGKLYPSVTNVGLNPTFGGQSEVRIETHILDFNEDIYSKNIEVFFISKIRGEKKFKGKEELMEQIRKDISTARSFLKV